MVLSSLPGAASVGRAYELLSLPSNQPYTLVYHHVTGEQAVVSVDGLILVLLLQTELLCKTHSRT